MKEIIYAYNDPLFPGEVFLFQRKNRFGFSGYPFLRLDVDKKIIEIGPSISARLTMSPLPFSVEEIIKRSEKANKLQTSIYKRIGDHLWGFLLSVAIMSE